MSLPDREILNTPSTTFSLGDRVVNRMGYGAMQLAGRGVFGPPRDRNAALAVLREAVANGVNHIDTSDYYGPHTTNQLIREALHPYPETLTIVTKVGGSRGADASWNPAQSPAELIRAVHDNLSNLGLDRKRHRLRAVLPTRRIQPAPVIDTVGCRRAPWRDSDAGCARVAAASLAEYSADPGHVVARPPAREHGGGSVSAA